MADIASRPAFAPRMPWRMIAVALVIISLLVAGAVFVGSRQTKLPPPFGPAGNGLVAYSANGDIYTADSITHAFTAIASGPEVDYNPTFSRDGTRVAFLRQTGEPKRVDLVATSADGKDLKVLTMKPLWEGDTFEWAPDNASLIVYKPGIAQIWRVDATKAAEPQVIAEHAYAATGSLRPPAGDQILYEPEATEGALWVMNIDGSGAHALVAGGAQSMRSQFSIHRWSPDGTTVVFAGYSADVEQRLKLYLMDADGNDIRPLTNAPDVHENDPVWSPDSTKIAYNRWPTKGGLLPIGIADVKDHSVVSAGPTAISYGVVIEWSPDGAKILTIPGPLVNGDPTASTQAPTEIDVETGVGKVVALPVGSIASWQRLFVEP